MDKMFSKKAWCKPVALASSTGLLVKNINIEKASTTSSKSSHDEDSFNDKENDLPEKSMLNLNDNFILIMNILFVSRNCTLLIT